MPRPSATCPGTIFVRRGDSKTTINSGRLPAAQLSEYRLTSSLRCELIAGHAKFDMSVVTHGGDIEIRVRSILIVRRFSSPGSLFPQRRNSDEYSFDLSGMAGHVLE